MLNPIEKLFFPLAAFRCSFFLAGTKAMTSRLVLDITVVDLVSGQSGIEQHGVMVFHDGVVDAVDEENGWILGGDTVLDGKALTEDSFVFSIFPEKGAA